MFASVHVADTGARAAVRAVLQRPKPEGVAGLRWSEVAPLFPLASTRPPSFRRVALIAFWDDEPSLDQFVDTHPLGERFRDGLHARMRPLRAHGSWTGLPANVPAGRAVPHEGPVVVLTLGRLRMSQTVRFLRTSRPAERSAAGDGAMLWGAAAARPPFVATISIWESSQATAAYAYGHQRPQHLDAIREQQRKDFHRESAFIRFAPVRLEGALGGRNPVDARTIRLH